jgi:hypothetical protein
MSGAGTIYCIDTSSILLWFVDTYPPAIFPGLVTRMEELIDAGRLRSPALSASSWRRTIIR